jgi:hypothetical protein
MGAVMGAVGILSSRFLRAAPKGQGPKVQPEVSS